VGGGLRRGGLGGFGKDALTNLHITERVSDAGRSIISDPLQVAATLKPNLNGVVAEQFPFPCMWSGGQQTHRRHHNGIKCI